MAVSLTGTARAAAPAVPAKGGDQILVAPPAPPNAKRLAEMGIAAAEPTTTPGVTYHPIPPVNAVRFFDQNGVLNGAVVVENPRRQRPWDWTPVWSMDVC